MDSAQLVAGNEMTDVTADFNLKDEDMIVIREEGARSDDAAKNRQNQQNYQNN